MTGASAAIALAFLLLLGAGLVAFVLRRRRVASGFADDRLLETLLGTDLRRTPRERVAIVAAAGIALAGALVDPAMGAGGPDRGGPVVLLLDTSGSMLVHDAGGPRLVRQREIAARLLDAVPHREVGIVAFSGRAFTLAPPTRDREAIAMYLDAVDPTIVTQTGSSAAAALRQGLALLGTGRGGTLVLIGDGEETEGSATTGEAARLAAAAGVPVHTVGVGSEAGAAVPALDLTTGEAAGVLRDSTGAPRISRLDDALLRDLADRTGGRYLRHDDARGIDRLAAHLAATGDRAPGRRGLWLVGLAFALLLLEPLARRERRVE